MMIVQSYSVAVMLLIVTMLCWGSWANTQKLATGKWPFQLFYWDYTFGLVLLALIFGLTLGSTGAQGRSFFADLAQADSANVSSALIGGVVFNIANLLLVAAIDMAGMAVAFPVGIGLALVLGVIINYISKSDGNPLLLFLGVALVTLAIVFNALAYRKLKAAEQSQGVSKGILIAALAGILMSTFYFFIARTLPGPTADCPACSFANPNEGALTPYSAVFIFTLGILASNFLWNSLFMYRPLKGEKVTYSAYFTQGTTKLHLIGILGGMIWCVGTSLSIITAEAASPAIAYGLGQGATLVAAVWGVFIWKEFANAPRGTNLLLALTFVSFLLGLGLVIVARLG